MFRKGLILAGLTIVLSLSAFGQTSPVSGNVTVQKGTATEPVPGALIEVYKVDSKSRLWTAKTDKKGHFSFAGFMLGTKYFLVISAPECSPLVWPNVRPGDEKIAVVLDPGDGKTMTEDEARQALAGGAARDGQAAGEMTAEQKKAQADFEAERKRVEAKNAGVKAKTEAVMKALAEGEAAEKIKDYNTAIAKYDEGFQADTDFAGTAPFLLIKKGESLRVRAVETYNKSTPKDLDPNQRNEFQASARKDVVDSADALKKALEILKAASPGDITPENAAKNKGYILIGIRELVKVAGQISLFDDGFTTIAYQLFPEYVSWEQDAAVKTTAKLAFADWMRGGQIAERINKAIETYRDILSTSPDNVDALAGLGLSLVNLGFLQGAEAEAANDKPKQEAAKALQQEGANVLQKYVAVAPTGHKFKADVEGMFEILKQMQIVPQKPTGGGKKKN